MQADRYNAVARLLHWLIAAMIAINLATGLLHDPLEKLIRLMPFHKALGLTVLVLSCARLGWRLAWTAPPTLPGMGAAEIAAARGVHVVLYALMIAMPLSGWIMSSASTYPLSWFGLFAVPKLAVAKGSALAGFAHEFHELGGWIMLALVAGHALAALRHHFILRDGVLRRML
ncbi:cytochrome b [Novosphingobium colocasiae]|uniref:Cytochrome b n=1 Tax=Novosphingobium colocasiae TaxID=1256513 RepID=A0A918UGQ3_9SPHN|nr:cytochrome b [Novosphingobium colocasiae]GGZ05312.1 cytochrome b [Novosphingobium colocasiae]